MRIDERIASGSEPAFSFEFFPPKTDDGEANLAAALTELARLEPTFVSVTYGAGGTPAQRDKTIDIVSRIKADHGLEAMAHFTCVGASVDELRTVLDRMRDAGIENVLALRGDPPAGVDASEWVAADGGLRYSRELIELIRADYDFAVGAACFPEVHLAAESAESDLKYTREKVDAGAKFLITQLFFDNQLYYDFVARARDAGIEVPIIPGIMPITNVAQIRRFTQMCGASIPPGLLRELELRSHEPEAVADFGVAYATMQCADLLANGAPGIHFYTLNRSPSTRAILSALRCMSPWRRAITANASRSRRSAAGWRREVAVGGLDQLHHVGAAVGRHRDADGQPDGRVGGHELDRQRRLDVLGHRGGRGAAELLAPAHPHAELVAAEAPGDAVAREDARDLGQHDVARAVAVDVVDGLEGVDVADQQRSALARGRARGGRCRSSCGGCAGRSGRRCGRRPRAGRRPR